MDIYYLVSVFELIAALTATIYFKRYMNTKEKYFLYFLWLSFLVDLSGATLSDYFLINASILYNIFMIISFVFYLFWYSAIIQKERHKRFIKGLIILLLAVVPYDIFTINWESFYKTIFIVGALSTIIGTLLYFLQLLNSNELLQIKSKLSFWISTGLLLFNVGMIPYFYLSDFLNINPTHQKIILVGLNLILYGCYTLGFIWSKQRVKPYS